MSYLADSVTQSARIVRANENIVLQPGDRVSIIVSALSGAEAFNMGRSLPRSPASDAESTTEVSAQTGYLVANDGTIQFLQLGKIMVKGLTTQQLEEKIQTALLQYLKQPIVAVDIINFKVNVLGEVNNPGTISVQDGKITILEAISRSGDLTINGLRDDILVIREKNGKREFGKLNLASNQIFTSPYFYLQQGDVVYVNMNKNKLQQSDVTQQKRFTVVSLIFAFVSTITLVFNVLDK